jgi:hypothetical protein
MMHGKLTLDAGVLSGRLPRGGLMDAAANAEFGGLELALSDAIVTVGRESDRRAEIVLDLSMDRDVMENLLHLLAERLDLPAFTRREWEFVRTALIDCHVNALDEDLRETAKTAKELADRIGAAYA